MVNRHDKKNIDNRRKRNTRHDRRALEEHSKTVTGFEFIEDMDLYFFSGSKNKPHSEYIVHFKLSEPVLLNHFMDVLRNKLRGVIIE